LKALITAGVTAGSLLLGLGAAAGTAVPAAAATERSVAADYTFDFETGTEGWTAHQDDKLPAGTVTWSSNQAKSGTHSLEFWMDGFQDDGTMWVQRTFPVPSGRSSVNVGLSFWVWQEGPTPSNPWQAVGQAGRNAPTKEEDFAELGPITEAGWTQYTLKKTVDVRNLSSIYVSFGLSVHWETAWTLYLDQARITISSIRGSGGAVRSPARGPASRRAGGPRRNGSPRARDPSAGEGPPLVGAALAGPHGDQGAVAGVVEGATGAQRLGRDVVAAPSPTRPRPRPRGNGVADRGSS
jgi:hypothetical protein